MKHWGGEAASMWTKETPLRAKLASVGRARVVTVGMPLALCEHLGGAGRAVMAAFARSRGAVYETSVFDLHARADLPAAAVLEVLTEGEHSFGAPARGYPAAFVDHDLTHWKELTGEDD